MFWRILSFFKPVGVPILERYYRFRDRMKLLQLRMAGQSIIRQLLHPERVESEKVVIFAAYPSDRTSSMHIRMLRRFFEAGYSVIVVSNHPNPNYVFENCLDEPWTFMWRHPFGRDFGAFRDATMLLHRLTEERGTRFKRVVYLNDSIATLSAAEPALIAHLDNPEFEFSGITENYHKGLHVGSFIMSVGEVAFYHPRMVRYWKQFKSLSTRRYAIGRGELGFSRAMRRAGFVPHVAWTLANMKERLMEYSIAQLMEIAESMEPNFRRQIRSPFDVVDDRLVGVLGANNLGMQAQSILQSILGRTRRQAKRITPQVDNSMVTMAMLQSAQAGPDPDSRAMRFVRFRERFVGFSEQEQIAVSQDLSRSDLVDAMLAYVFRGSQIHHGAAPLLYLGAGILKKDVVLRRIVEPFDIEILLTRSLGGSAEGEIEAVVREVLAKGHPYSLSGWNKLLNDWDFT